MAPWSYGSREITLRLRELPGWILQGRYLEMVGRILRAGHCNHGRLETHERSTVQHYASLVGPLPHSSGGKRGICTILTEDYYNNVSQDTNGNDGRIAGMDWERAEAPIPSSNTCSLQSSDGPGRSVTGSEGPTGRLRQPDCYFQGEVSCDSPQIAGQYSVWEGPSSSGGVGRGRNGHCTGQGISGTEPGRSPERSLWIELPIEGIGNQLPCDGADDEWFYAALEELYGDDSCECVELPHDKSSAEEEEFEFDLGILPIEEELNIFV